MSRQHFYKLISNAADLKALHDEAKFHGKLEVGLSKGKLLYAWDEDRNSIRSISQEEAAQRLGVTVSAIDQIVATNAAVVLEEPQAITEEAEKEAVFQEETLPVVEQIEPDEDLVEESKETKAEEEPTSGQPVTDPVDEPSVLEEVNAPESIQEDQETQPKEVKDVNGPILALVDDIIAALEKFKNSISN